MADPDVSGELGPGQPEGACSRIAGSPAFKDFLDASGFGTFKCGGSKYKTRDWAKANKTEDMHQATLKEIEEKDAKIVNYVDPHSAKWAETVAEHYRKEAHCQHAGRALQCPAHRTP